MNNSFANKHFLLKKLINLRFTMEGYYHIPLHYSYFQNCNSLNWNQIRLLKVLHCPNRQNYPKMLSQ